MLLRVRGNMCLTSGLERRVSEQDMPSISAAALQSGIDRTTEEQKALRANHALVAGLAEAPDEKPMGVQPAIVAEARAQEVSRFFRHYQSQEWS